MTTAAQTIADLDSALREAGETVRLSRLVLGPAGAQIPFEVECRALIRPLGAGELRGSGQPQQSQRVILSPSEISAAQWPGASPSQLPADPRIPVKGDRMMTTRGPMMVQTGTGFYLADHLVRIECEVKG